MAKKYATKTQCINFIEAVKRKALRSVEERYAERKEVIQQEIIERNDILGKTKHMQNLIKEIIEINESLKFINDPAVENKQPKYYYKDSISRNIESDYKYSVNTVVDHSVSDLTQFEKNYISKIFEDRYEIKDPRYLEILEEEKQELTAVKENYNKVLTEASTLHNGKRVVKFLQDLGFDVSSLIYEEDSSNTIDTSKLFVCGEKK